MRQAWGKRVAVDHDQVQVVFRIEQQPGEPDAEKKFARLYSTLAIQESTLRRPGKRGQAPSRN
jgi:hypothetical protein